ncbi:RIB43A-like with coiled-coils protein 1 [Chanos chanos]|uniref:RIB43A-like with coiled-coils protein 1 n=1 Tax=Chanos chanos TaxID=29144 RepID=A0A6J2V1B4_CHACN|nr:RIB43A-like with coiled-coils protein 1 [Chanos chanos]
MFRAEPPEKDIVAKAVERRRAAEAARRVRIFNTKNRVMGLDLPAIENQVTEKREREKMEKQRDRAYELLGATIDEVLRKRQTEEEERRTELSRDLVHFWATEQRAEDSRDADLTFNHQGAVKLSHPKSEMGPACMQVFAGEGIGEREKKRAQMEENERVLRAQRDEREQRQQKQKLRELLTDMEMVQLDQRAVHLDALESECKRAACIALSSYNQAQAEERTERLRQEKMKKEGEELMEVKHMVTSDLLTECLEAAERQGVGTADRTPGILCDRWKGMRAEQLSAIHRQQEEQRSEKERQRQIERQTELAWDVELMRQARAQEEEEKRLRELERERRIQLDNVNQQLATEQRAYQQYLNKNVYTNRPSARFFSQFGSSTR